MLTLALLLIVVQDRPAPTIQPDVPPVAPREAPAPEPAELHRDGFVTGRLTVQGQKAVYTFEAKQGELSLFDLGDWGFTRGWASTIGLRITGPGGEVQLESEKAGGTVFRSFQAFSAPTTGRYSIELSAPRHGYRFTLVRHSSYQPRGAAEVRPLTGDRPLHGYLADADDEARYQVELEAGVPVLVWAGLTHPMGERQARSLRARQPLRVVRGKALVKQGRRRPGMDEAAMRGALRPTKNDFPALTLEVRGPDGEVLTAGRHAALFTPPSSGRHLLTVSARGASEGGLFDLALELSPALVTVAGYVGDADDEPVAGVTVHLLLEPGFDPLVTARSDADGEWTTLVPPGAYTVLLLRAEQATSEGQHVERVQTRIDGIRDLNLIWSR
jgi:Carboxypeptidase regulatory-like domain